MISMIKEWIFLIRQYRKQKKLASNIQKAEFHALIALSYWKKCEEQCDLQFEIETTGKYVRLGK